MYTPREAQAYTGQLPAQKYPGVTPELLDLLAMQKVAADKKAAADQLAAQSGQAQPTVAQGMEQQAMHSARQEIQQKLGLPGLANQGQNAPQAPGAQPAPGGQPPAAQQQMAQAQAPMQRMAAGGLVAIPSNLPAGYAGGGIVSFAGPDGSSVEDPSEARLLPAALVAAIVAGKYALPQLDSIATGLGYADGASLASAASSQIAADTAGAARATLPKSALGKLGVAGALGATAATTYGTPTEDYRKRFGMETNDPSFLGDIGIRALGAASDLGDTVTLGYAGSYYRDKQEKPPAAPAKKTARPTAPAAPAATGTPATGTPTSGTGTTKNPGGLRAIVAQTTANAGVPKDIPQTDFEKFTEEQIKAQMKPDLTKVEADSNAMYDKYMGAGDRQVLAENQRVQALREAQRKEQLDARNETFLGMKMSGIRDYARAAKPGATMAMNLIASVEAGDTRKALELAQDTKYLDTVQLGVDAMNKALQDGNKLKFSAAKDGLTKALEQQSSATKDATSLVDARNQAAGRLMQVQETARGRLALMAQHATERNDRVALDALDKLNRRADAVGKQAADVVKSSGGDEIAADKARTDAVEKYLKQTTEYADLNKRLGFSIQASQGGMNQQLTPAQEAARQRALRG